MLTFRDFNYSDEDYAIEIAIHDAVLPDDPLNEENLRRGDEIRPKSRYFQRIIAEIDGTPVGSGRFSETWWNEVPDQYEMTWRTHPTSRKQGIATAFYQLTLDRISADGRKIGSLTAGTREDLPEGIRWLENNEFTLQVRYLRPELKLAEFDPAPFAHYPQRLIENNLQIKPLAEIIPSDPDWQRRLYDLDWILEQDEPHSEPPKRPPFDEYVKEQLEAPNFDANCWFIALDGSHYAGMTILYSDKMKPDILFTDWTGVDRPYRKKGLAIAMKLFAIDYATQQPDITRLQTDNHEDNWMYQINLRLGFHPIPAHLDYIKEMTTT